MTRDAGSSRQGAESARRGTILLRIARQHLETTLLETALLETALLETTPRQRPPEFEDPKRLDEPWLFDDGAVFVTLRKHTDGALRGCIGSLVANRPLIDDLRDHVIGAALRDPRFPAVEANELAEVHLEITLLSPLEAMTVTDEADAQAQLRPGEDGIVLRFGQRRATFLPQVWDSLPTPESFLRELKRKAGLALDFWHEDVELERYGVRKWCEVDPIEG